MSENPIPAWIKARHRLRARTADLTAKINAERKRQRQTAGTRMSHHGLSFLREHEGVRLKPYDDSRGFATTGVGHLIAQKPVAALSAATIRKWTFKDVAAAEHQLAKDLGVYEAAVREVLAKRRGGAKLGQNSFDALVSFCFNIGVQGLTTSTAARRIIDGSSKASIADAMAMWRKPPEIIGRRNDEIKLFLK